MPGIDLRSARMKSLIAQRYGGPQVQNTTHTAKTQHTQPKHNTHCQNTTHTAKTQHTLPKHNTHSQNTTHTAKTQHTQPKHNTHTAKTQHTLSKHNTQVATSLKHNKPYQNRKKDTKTQFSILKGYSKNNKRRNVVKNANTM